MDPATGVPGQGCLLWRHVRQPHLCVWWQLFWEKKLSGLNAFDIAEELVKTMDLPKGLQGNSGVGGGQVQGSRWLLQHGEQP